MGKPPGGWFPNQRVTTFQALKGYTVDAAYASFREHELGAITPGFYADLTILDRDILTIDPAKILDTSVLGTIVGGRVVFSKLNTLQDLEKVDAYARAVAFSEPASSHAE